ncbi:hypothetical protein DFJ66_2386 [Saccharothrix variisporea]|uniref:Uncharacterized protein n=1 Tax=Saccharothrix variisporea TaxID=543527 RepID=A0A495X5B1_9PSEU|nr:hypothetical protein DFJ66_2386 [Saccharothrix variisporea]
MRTIVEQAKAAAAKAERAKKQNRISKLVFSVHR